MPGKPRWSIRDATLDDAKELIDMHAQSWIDTYPNAEEGVSRDWVERRVAAWSLEGRRQRIRETHDNPDMLYRVAVDSDGKVIGMICPTRDKNEQRVGGLYIDKQYYGTGLAQQLMDQIIAWADPHRPLSLEVATYNERAKRFYEKYGFHEIPNSEEKHKETIPLIKMTRKGDKQ